MAVSIVLLQLSPPLALRALLRPYSAWSQFLGRMLPGTWGHQVLKTSKWGDSCRPLWDLHTDPQLPSLPSSTPVQLSSTQKMVGAILGASLPCSSSKDNTSVAGGDSECQGLGQVCLRVPLTLRSLLLVCLVDGEALLCVDPMEKERSCLR